MQFIRMEYTIWQLFRRPTNLVYAYLFSVLYHNLASSYACNSPNLTPSLLFFPFIFTSWRLITLQYCSGFGHTLTWISHGFTCVPHPNPPSRLPLHPIVGSSVSSPYHCILSAKLSLSHFSITGKIHIFKDILEAINVRKCWTLFLELQMVNFD